MKNFAIASVAGLALAATASAQTLDISGFTYDTGLVTNGVGTIHTLGTVNSSGSVTSIEFNLDFDSLGGANGSWGSEVNIDIDGPNGFHIGADGNDVGGAGGIDDGPDDITFGWGNSAGNFTFVGSIAVSGDAGLYTFTLFEEFNDSGTGNDGIFNAGSTITLVPAPDRKSVV